MLAGDIVTHVAASRHVRAEDAKALRRIVYHDGTIDVSELEMLFVLDETAHRRDPVWSAFFVEAVTDFIVNQEEPCGCVSPENAQWLIDHISRDGVVTTPTELELLVTVMEKATVCPDELSAFALAQVKRAIVEGVGPLANGVLTPGRVGTEEANMMRRILLAFGGEANVAVTRAEAEMLFDINDATANADNDPAWNDLFVKALANTLMTASGYDAPTREVALDCNALLSSRYDAVGAFCSRSMSGGGPGVMDAYREPGLDESRARRNGQLADAVAVESVDEDNAAWLAARIGRDGKLHENEKAALRAIAEQSSDLHPSLRLLMRRVV